MKKIISVLLTAILLCCFIFSSFAEEAQDIDYDASNSAPW